MFYTMIWRPFYWTLICMVGLITSQNIIENNNCHHWNYFSIYMGIPSYSINLYSSMSVLFSPNSWQSVIHLKEIFRAKRYQANKVGVATIFTSVHVWSMWKWLLVMKSIVLPMVFVVDNTHHNLWSGTSAKNLLIFWVFLKMCRT